MKNISEFKYIIRSIVVLVLLLLTPLVSFSQNDGTKTEETADTAAENIDKQGAAKIQPSEQPGEKSPDTSEKPEKPEKEPEKDTSAVDDAEKKHVNMIEKTLKYGIHKNRVQAVKMILSLKKKSSKDYLVKLLNEEMKTEENAEVKKTAITVVSELGYTSSMPWILDSLDDDTDSVRIEAVYAIKRMKYGAAKDVLIKYLKQQSLNENSNFTEAIIRTLGELKAGEITEYIINGIRDTQTSENNRQLMVMFLGNVNSPAARDYLVKLLKDTHEDKTIRAYAASSLARIGDKSVAPELNRVIDDIESYPFNKRKTYYNLYIYCVAALAKLGDESAVPRLEDALRSDNAVVRVRAIKLIKELKNKRTIDILKYKMEYDPSPTVQRAAREALKEMGVDVEEDDKQE